MSTILKALRRLERETAVSDRPLREAVTAVEEGRRRSHLRWLLPAAALWLGAIAGAGALMLWTEAAPSPEAVDVASAPPPPPADSTRPAVVAPELAEAPSPYTSRVAVVSRPERAPMLSDATPVEPRHVDPVDAQPQRFAAARPVILAEAGPAPATDPWIDPAPVEPAIEAPALAPETPQVEIEAPPALSPTPEPVAVEPAPEPIAEAPAPRSQPVVAEPLPAPATLAEPSAAPAPITADRIRVARTVWHPLPERREALIHLGDEEAGTRVREGERVADYLVVRIEPSGVVFSDGKDEVKRPVGR